MIICMIDVKMKLHLCKEPDKFQFVVLAHNIGWQIYWLFSDDQRIKSIEGQVTEAGASGSDLVSSTVSNENFCENGSFYFTPKKYPVLFPTPNQYNPNQIFQIGNGFGFFLIS